MYSLYAWVLGVLQPWFALSILDEVTPWLCYQDKPDTTFRIQEYPKNRVTVGLTFPDTFGSTRLWRPFTLRAMGRYQQPTCTHVLSRLQSHVLLAPSPRCMFWTQEPHLTLVMLLSCSRTLCSQISQSDCRSKPPEQPPRVPSALWQLRSTGHLLSHNSLCTYTSATWRGMWGWQAPEKSMFSF